MRPEPSKATEPKPVVDLSDPEAVAARNKSLKGREARLKNGLKLVLAHPDSRLWLHDLIFDKSRPLEKTFTGNSETFFRCGQQEIGKFLILVLFSEFIDEYMLMVKEAANV